MTTYADPTRCPDCHSLLGEAPQTCPRCALPLSGPTVTELFSTLQRADLLLAALRQQKVLVPAGSRLEDVPRYPAPAPRPASSPTAHAPRSLSGASVPKILLTLGALCLLVAAVTFLAVAWSWLGIGGRTAVLLLLTAVALDGADVLARRGLRMAGEAVTVVGLGLVGLDVIGARHAGWLGNLTDAGLVTVLGAVVATVSLILLATTAPRPLVTPALVAPLAVLTAGIGVQATVDSPLPMVLTTLALLGLGRVGVLVHSAALRLTSLLSATLAWCSVVAYGLVVALEHDTVIHLWGQVAVWPLLAAVMLAAVAAPVLGFGRIARLAGYSVAALLGSYVAVLAVLDNGLTEATLALLGCLVAWTVVAVVVPRPVQPVALLPLAGVAVLPVLVLLDLVADASHATFGVGAPFTQACDVPVVATSPAVPPWLAAVIPVLLTAAGCTVVGMHSTLRRAAWLWALAVAAITGAVLTLPLYDVPLAAVVALLLVVALAGFGLAEQRTGPTADAIRAAAVVPGLLAVLAALPNDVLTTVVLAGAAGVSAHLMRRFDLTGDLGTVTFAAAVGGLGWAAGSALSVPEVWRAIPVMLVLGGLALWRPEPVLEVSAAVVATFTSTAAVLLATDTSQALAIHLTLAGALVTASALIHPTRRFLAWPGGALLMLATWVRLAELGVHVLEAYTLPAAVALVAVGGWRLHRDDATAAAGTTMSLLAPGLTLATVPSLLVALDDPSSLRALLLGLGCLALVVAGVTLRWTAPLVVGAVVGAVLVLRELAPYAAALPPWVVIGLSGSLLLAVGVTWESRLREVRTASRYVASLR